MDQPGGFVQQCCEPIIPEAPAVKDRVKGAKYMVNGEIRQCVGSRKVLNKLHVPKQPKGKQFSDFEGVTPTGKKKVDCWSGKNEKQPSAVSWRNGNKWSFDCDVCGHNFEASIHNINKSNGTWCPYCGGHEICQDEDCKQCFHKSFASSTKQTKRGKRVLDCWNVQKNVDMRPRDVAISSTKKAWFDCDTCEHSFECSLGNIKIGRWCPYCAIPLKKLCPDDDCQPCFDKSFASCIKLTRSGKRILDCWNVQKNVDMRPRDVAISSTKKAWFDCDICRHTFASYPSGVSNGTWCQYCAGKKRCNNDSCEPCFYRSFDSCKLLTATGKRKVDCWSHKNEVKPRDIARGTHFKYTFSCDSCCCEFILDPSHILQGVWCPHCPNKTELKLYTWLLKNRHIKSVEREYKPKWCSTPFWFMSNEGKVKFSMDSSSRTAKQNQYRFDFLVTFKNGMQLIIELDGRQHFAQIKNWNKPLHTQIRDAYKERKANENGLLVVRCIQEDVYLDKNNWEKKLEGFFYKFYGSSDDGV